MESVKICLNLLKYLQEEHHNNMSLTDTKMRKQRVADSMCYNATMSAFTNVVTSDVMERAAKLLQHMEDMQMTDKISYNIIMNGWKKIGNDFRADQLRNNIRKRQFSRNNIKFVPRKQNFLSESQITQDESDSVWSQILHGI